QGIKSVDSLPAGRVAIKEANFSTGANLGDDDLKQVALLPEIETVLLAGTKTTPTGLAQLHGLTTLRKIDLGTLRLPPASVEQLRKALPACQVTLREPTDVEVARQVLAGGGRVDVAAERNQRLSDISDVSKLPAGQYTLRSITLDATAPIDDAFLDELSELPF